MKQIKLLLLISLFGCKRDPDVVINGVGYYEQYICTKYEYKTITVNKFIGKSTIPTCEIDKVCVDWKRELIKAE